MSCAKHIIRVSLFALLTACNTLTEDYRECGVWLEFVFDHNMEFVDSFSTQVETVEVALFDDRGLPVRNVHAEVSSLVGRNRMWVGGIPAGRYTVLTVGNYTPEHFLLDNSTLDRASVALKEASTSRRFPHLFGGRPILIDVTDHGSVHRVPMMRHTNRFDVALQVVGAPSTRAVAHTVEIEAPEAGAYDIHDRPLDLRGVTYRPHTLDERSAHLNTMRLLEQEGEYRIVVRATGGTCDELWSGQLLPLLAATKPAARPDGTPLPSAEYFDREGQWNIVIVCRDGGVGGAFVAQKIVINGWVVWQNGMEL